MKYDFAVKPATLDHHQQAHQAGWITLYHYDAETLEYVQASMEYLPVGIGLPAHSAPDAPTVQPATDMALIRDLAANQWIAVEDHRHKKGYHIETKHESLILALGPIPPTQTLIKPTHPCDQWTGSVWVLDQAALKARAMADARQQKAALLHQATDHINILLDAVALDNQQADLQQLAAYKHYRVALMRIDPDTAPEIDWPEWPQ